MLRFTVLFAALCCVGLVILPKKVPLAIVVLGALVAATILVASSARAQGRGARFARRAEIRKLQHQDDGLPRVILGEGEGRLRAIYANLAGENRKLLWQKSNENK